ncbi:MFS transporter [Entomobacter blattae]|uniref:Enterobactin exporter EntS n=1 Tax=Entomobacter blattae TaxID=2762277 RepID=A0A7H1NNZ3_9PROT|nr:MFS transporter [Entomobacter blattae]QNT77503.1 Enterobactin exporter EntS [Entomobacter blattae]
MSLSLKKLFSYSDVLQQAGASAFLTSRCLSALSSQIQAVAVGWQVYALTHDVRSLGLIGLMQFLPMITLVLLAGHAADQFNRRYITTSCQIVEGVAAFYMALGSYFHWLSVHEIYIMVIIFGAARAFEMPSQQTFLVSLVPPTLFPKATALSSSLFQTASLIGPSLGGLLYGLGASFAYSIACTGFLCSALATFSMKLNYAPAKRTPLTLASIFGGISFIRSRRIMLGAISLDLFAVLLGGATAMLPVYANDILHSGPITLGILRSAPAIGALTVALILSRWPLTSHAGRWMFGSVAVFGLATILFGFSSSAPLSIAALTILGGADVFSVVIRSSLVQLGTPDEMRGRVSAINMVFIGSSNQLGEFESGMLASFTGPVYSVVIGGMGTLLIAFLWARAFPELFELDRLDETKPL